MSEEAAEPAAPAGGNNKMMFMMMGVMLLVMLGGMGGMYFMMQKNLKAATAGGEHEEAAAASEHGEGGEHGEGAVGAAIYVGFEPPFVVNFPADSSVKFLQTTVQIMTRDQAVEHEIKANDPAIRDAILNLLAQQTADKLATAEGKEELKAHALEAVREVVKKEGGVAEKVEAVYFTTFVMQ